MNYLVSHWGSDENTLGSYTFDGVNKPRDLYEKLRNRPLGSVDGDVGAKLTLVADLAPGQTCRAEYRGASWTALNVGSSAIPAGAEARIESVDGLTLKVRSAVSEE